MYEYVALSWGTHKPWNDQEYVVDYHRLATSGWVEVARGRFEPKRVGGACIMRRPKDEPCELTEEKAQCLRAQVERDLKRDVEELREKVRVTGETLNRWYQFRCRPKDEPRMWTEGEIRAIFAGWEEKTICCQELEGRNAGLQAAIDEVVAVRKERARRVVGEPTPEAVERLLYPLATKEKTNG